MEKATFGAGCFWGIQSAFDKVNGVVSTRVGYSGGNYENPTYKDVCSHKTGHAEVVKVIYDPSIISYKELLDVFWMIHDPTTLNRQGPDIGSQYRSVIYYHSDEQKKIAIKSKEQVDKSGKFKRPIVTFIEAAKDFYEAEEYHQKFHEKRKKSEYLF